MPLKLGPSANWYSSGALSSDGANLLVTCARSSLLVASPQLDGASPSLTLHGVVNEAHRDRATAALVWRDEVDTEACEEGDVRVVSCGQDGFVKLWCCRIPQKDGDGEVDEVFEYKCHRQHNVHGSVAVASVDRSRHPPHVVISVDERGTFAVWDSVAHTTRRVQLPERGTPTELRCSPHTELVVALAGKRGLLWTVSLAAGGRVLQKFRGHDQDVTSISWCPELTSLLSVQQDHLLASTARDNSIRVWGTRSGRCHVTQPLRPGGAEGRQRPHERGPGDTRPWLTLLWTEADCLYSSGLSGQLLRWRLTTQGEGCEVLHRVHGRGLFNIAPLRGGAVLTSGIDRNLVVYDRAQQRTGAVPTLGGAVHALHASPVDPSRLAVGCGDCTIRVWNLGAQADYAVTTLWHGIKAKVLSVAWHPEDDSRLAFGTDEGRVGICFPNAASKPAVVCAEHHAASVYCVAWGADGALYSLGLGEVWRHEPARLNATRWSAAAGRAACSQIAFGGGGVAVGRQDGSVQLMTSSGVVRTSAIGHRKLVTSLAWAPVVTAGDITPLAVASYDTHISVFDVPRLDGSGSAPLLQARLTLTGHKSRVLAVSWSPHQADTLVSASQDATVRVWDTAAGTQRSLYTRHPRAVRCCLPHPLQQEWVLSGGDDACLHCWRPDRQPAEQAGKHATERGVAADASADAASTGAHKKKKRKQRGSEAVTYEQELSDADTEGSGRAPGQPRDLGDGRKPRSQRSLFPLSAAAENRGKAHSHADLQLLLDSVTSRQLRGLTSHGAAANRGEEDVDVTSHGAAANSGAGNADVTPHGVAANGGAGNGDVLSYGSAANGGAGGADVTSHGAVANRGEGGADVTSHGAVANRGEEGADVTSHGVAANCGAGITQERAHLGLFGDGAAFMQMIEMEVSQHRAQQSLSQLVQFSVWSGDTARLVRTAAAQAKLTDQLLSLAPMVSYRFWKEMSVLYAAQLENEKEVTRAASVLLACHQVSEAIAMLTRHGHYREALCVSRLRLPPDHPTNGLVTRQWAQQLTSDGNLELAAKCYIWVCDFSAAASVLSRRSDAGSLRLAARLSWTAGDAAQSRALALQALHTGCLRADWDAALAAAALTPQPQAALRMCLAHRELVRSAEQCPPHLYLWAAGLLSCAASEGRPPQSNNGETADERAETEHEGDVHATSRVQSGLHVSEEVCRDGGEVLSRVSGRGHSAGDGVVDRGVDAMPAGTGGGDSPATGAEGSRTTEDATPAETGGGDNPAMEAEGSRTTKDATPDDNPASEDISTVYDSAAAADCNPASTCSVSSTEAAGVAGASLLERVRSSWRRHGCHVTAETAVPLKTELHSVRLHTRPSTAKQLWLSVAADICVICALPENLRRDELVNVLTRCQGTVPSQLPVLCCLLVPHSGCLMEDSDGRQLILSSVLVVLRQSVVSDVGGANSQCTELTPDGSDEPPANLAHYLRLWRGLRGEDKNEADELVLSEISGRLAQVL